MNLKVFKKIKKGITGQDLPLRKRQMRPIPNYSSYDKFGN